MTKEVKNIGLMEVLQAKAVLGLPVAVEDVEALALIVNHNADALTELANKVDALTERLDLEAKVTDELFGAQAECMSLVNESLEGLVNIAEMHSEDLDGVYDDINNIATVAGILGDGKFVRVSEMEDLNCECCEDMLEGEADFSEIFADFFAELMAQPEVTDEDCDEDTTVSIDLPDESYDVFVIEFVPVND